MLNSYKRRGLTTSPTIHFAHRSLSIGYFLKLFLIFIVYGNVVNACMPGYEGFTNDKFTKTCVGERSRLRQYLGIEWIPQGLDKMDAQQLKQVRHPSELNCDFSAPEKCKWQNVKKGLDDLEFYLFRKEDYNEFPVLQIRPGPSNVAVGDQLILTGDKKKDEQAAILASYPIKCQNSTGKLTFTFWLYNGARVEVLILEENPADHQINIHPEKPQVICGAYQIETECTVEIPSREQPFRIGIRAYDIRNRDGAFVMLDNIVYEAQFCRVSINFGHDFHTESLITGATGDYVKTKSQLSCRDFDKNCRWRNGGESDHLTMWRKATSAIPGEILFNETGTSTQPATPFTFIYIEEGSDADTKSKGCAFFIKHIGDNNSPKIGDKSAVRRAARQNRFKMLVSDPVQCVSSMISTISFKTWATKGIELSVCVLDMEMSIIECQKVPMMARSPSTLTHNFQISKTFMFAFRLASVNTGFDNFLAIDDIEYEGATCADAVNVFDVGKDFYTSPLLSALKNRPLHSDLKCDFAKRALDCQWANMERNEGIRWEAGLGQIDSMKFASLSPRRAVPETEMAVVKLLTPNSTAVLLSERIKCLVEASTFSFSFWRTGTPSLSICILSFETADSFDIIDCQAIENWEVDNVVVDIPHLDQQIWIALKADSHTGTGIIGVDNITFEGKLCQPIAFGVTSKIAGTGFSRPLASSDNSIDTHSVPDENVCRLLSCNFDHASMCLYSSFRVLTSVSMFRPFNGAVNTMLFDRSRMAVLESPVFRLNAPARLHFDYAVTKGAADLHICQDRQPQKGLNHDFIEILPTDTKIYIIAKLHPTSTKVSSVMLDNIELTGFANTTNGKQICS